MRRIFFSVIWLTCLGSGLGAALIASAQEKSAPAEKTQPVIHRPDVTAPDQPAATKVPETTVPETTVPETTVTAPSLPPEAHPWGRFPVGSWKVVRLTTESLDSLGHVTSTSITETKTTLVEATDQDYVLRVEVNVDVAGKRFSHPAQITRHSYWGELANGPAGVRKVSTSELDLNGKKIPCEVRQVASDLMGQKRQSQIHYSASTYPYVLKRESVLTAEEGMPQTTSVETIATNLPQRVFGVLRPVAFVRTTRQLPKGDSLTMEVQSPDVPGGVISHSAQERDAASTVVRRTSLELLDFGIGSETPDEASPGRRRWFRSRGRRGDDMSPSRRDR